MSFSSKVSSYNR